MMQRIQSVYLFVVALLCGLTIFFPLAKFISGNTIETLYSYGLLNETTGLIDYSSLGISLLLGLTSLLSFITLFLYKKRVLQIRLTVFSILLLIGFYGYIAYYSYFHCVDIHSFRIDTGVFLPLIAFILQYLSIRAIGKDEVLIRSLDRIR